MISSIPTFSAKKLVFTPKLTRFILLGIGIIFIVFLAEPWLAIPLIAYSYLLTIPFSFWAARKLPAKSRT